MVAEGRQPDVADQPQSVQRSRTILNGVGDLDCSRPNPIYIAQDRMIECNELVHYNTIDDCTDNVHTMDVEKSSRPDNTTGTDGPAC